MRVSSTPSTGRKRSVTVSGPGIEPSRKARYHGDQGCTILPAGVDRIFLRAGDIA